MNLSLRYAVKEDELCIMDIFRRSSDYFLKVEGCVPDEAILQNELSTRPPNPSPEYKKAFLLIVKGNSPVGVVDLHLHHPDKAGAYIALFLVVQDERGQSLGSKAYALLEEYCVTHGIRHIRLGVSDDTDASAFWVKRGFSRNGRSYDFQGQNRVTHTVEYAKTIAPA